VSLKAFLEEKMMTLQTKIQAPHHQDQVKNQFRSGGSNRRKTKRRLLASEGYAYISMVGWMDRRIKTRRENDKIDF
jgi:hypothetical protein